MRFPRLHACGLLIAALVSGPLTNRVAFAQDVPPSRDTQGSGWATARATELVQRGQQHVAHGDAQAATQCFLDAIRFDATAQEAYLALAALYEGAGDVREAERTYAIGLEHVVGFTQGFLARSRLRTRLGQLNEAVADLESAAALAPDDVAVLRDLGAGYVSVKALPAALAVTRRIAALADAKGDDATSTDARKRAKALSKLVAEADPVMAGRRDRGPVRQALSALATRK